MTNHHFPEKVAANLEILKDLSVGHVAALINQRAGRVAKKEVEAVRVINQFNLIEQELLEGKKAAADGDVIRVRDAIADILLLAAGQQGLIQGLDVDADYRSMCAYNMTRIPATYTEATATQDKYQALGIETEIHPTMVEGVELFPVVCIDKDQTDINGDHYPPRKFVKSVEFIDAEYTELEGVTLKTGVFDHTHVGERLTAGHVQILKNIAVLQGVDLNPDVAGLISEFELSIGVRVL